MGLKIQVNELPEELTAIIKSNIEYFDILQSMLNLEDRGYIIISNVESVGSPRYLINCLKQSKYMKYIREITGMRFQYQPIKKGKKCLVIINANKDISRFYDSNGKLIVDKYCKSKLSESGFLLPRNMVDNISSIL
jgi:hypothetical protein